MRSPEPGTGAVEALQAAVMTQTPAPAHSPGEPTGVTAPVSETATGEDNPTPVTSIDFRNQNVPDPVEGVGTERPPEEAQVDAPASVAHDAVAASMSAACSEIPVPALAGAVAAEAPTSAPPTALTLTDVIPIHFRQHKASLVAVHPVAMAAPRRRPVARIAAGIVAIIAAGVAVHTLPWKSRIPSHQMLWSIVSR